MSLNDFDRPGAVAAAILALLLTAALPAPTALPQRASLAGQLLVAAPSMGDPRFYQTVIMLVRHDRTGAMGIVVNRPLLERPLAALLEALGERADAAAGNVRIFAGGPVQPELGFVLHSAEYRRPDTLEIDGHVAMTSSREILRDIAANRGPKQSLVAFGYAGWAPGQLEGELMQGGLVHCAGRLEAHLRAGAGEGVGERRHAPDAGSLRRRAAPRQRVRRCCAG